MHKIVNTYKEAKTQFYKRLHKPLGLTIVESDLLATIYFLWKLYFWCYPTTFYKWLQSCFTKFN